MSEDPDGGRYRIRTPARPRKKRYAFNSLSEWLSRLCEVLYHSMKTIGGFIQALNSRWE